MAKILIIDDSRLMRTILKKFLSQNGHIVIGNCSDGVDGANFYKELKPDLVFLDITMPNKDGKTCLKEILEIDKNARVIMISSVSEQAQIDYCMELGAKKYIIKPLNFKNPEYAKDFIKSIDEVLK